MENGCWTNSGLYRHGGLDPLSVLPWVDVVFQHIFVYLKVPVVYSLRRVSKQWRLAAEQYFQYNHTVDLTRIGAKINAVIFTQITQSSCMLHTIILRNSKDWLTDQLVCPVFENNKRLTCIDCTGCSSLSNASIHTLAVNCRQLRDLYLRDCHWLSSDSVLVIAMNCRQLQRLDITGCWEVENQALIVLSSYCSKLHFLSIAKIYGVTDSSVKHLAQHCGQLRHLNMQGCWRVTDDAVKYLGEYCKELQALQIRECRDITEISLSKLRVRGIRLDMPILRSHMQQSQLLRYLKLQV